MKNITVAGAGVLGSQIAFQSAFHDFNVTIYDTDTSKISKKIGPTGPLWSAYKRDLKATDQQLQSAMNHISYTDDLKAAVEHADIVIEAIPENLEIKREFYKKLSQVVPLKTIIATNSSTLRPSDLASAVDRPERFLALHFANRIWRNNTAEVMGHPGTDTESFNEVVDFAKSIGMVALPLNKEQPGYILNSLLVPWLESAQALVVNGVAEPEIVDKTWMIATHAPMGPFATLDIIGLRTPYQISLARAAQGSKHAKKVAEWLKTEFLDKNKLGVETGEGFYKYPNPSFQSPDFLK